LAKIDIAIQRYERDLNHHPGFAWEKPRIFFSERRRGQNLSPSFLISRKPALLYTDPARTIMSGMSKHLDDFAGTLLRATTPWKIGLKPTQVAQLRTHYAMMIETNRVMNLTRITDPNEAAIKHYADSLALLSCVMEHSLPVRRVLDIGTGAGFPAIPLAVACPDWLITAIDATRKKVDFVRRVSKAIALSNLCCKHTNSTHWKTDQVFDLVTLRAVAHPVETAQRFVAPGGYVACFIGKDRVTNSSKQAPDMENLTPQTHPYCLSLGTEIIHRQLLLLGPKTQTERSFSTGR